MSIGVTTVKKNDFTVEQKFSAGINLGGAKLNTISAMASAGVIPPDSAIVTVDNNATGVAMTLADGVEGQRMNIIQLSEDAGTNTTLITVANLLDNSEGPVNTITLDAVGETCELIFLSGSWRVLNLLGATISNV